MLPELSEELITYLLQFAMDEVIFVCRSTDNNFKAIAAELITACEHRNITP